MPAVHTEKTKEAIRVALRHRWSLLTSEEKEIETARKRSKFHPESWKASIAAHYKKKRESQSWEECSPDMKRRRVIEEQEGSCSSCGLKEWMSKPIAIELEHKDGNNRNNARENLTGLCPNCHSLTPTWRGRNKPDRNGNNHVSDAELIVALNECKNIRQALLRVGMAAKGNNYERAKRLLEQGTI